MPSNETEIKCVVVGDGAVGKTCLVKVYVDNKFPEGYVPTVFENTYLIKEYRGLRVNLGIWDTAGQEDYDRLRPLSYPGANVIVLCLSIVGIKPFDNINYKWLPEVRHHCPNVPYILAATKSDLREDPQSLKELANKGLQPVTPEQIKEFSEEIKVFGYQECSSRLNKGVNELFELVMKAVLFPNEGANSKSSSGATSSDAKKKNCLLM